MVCTDADFVSLVMRLLRQILISEEQRVKADDCVQGSPHFMAHAGKKICLGLVAVFHRGQLGFQTFIFPDLIGNSLQNEENDEYEYASAKENPGNNEIRFPQKADKQVADQEHDEQNHGNVQDHLSLTPFFL